MNLINFNFDQKSIEFLYKSTNFGFGNHWVKIGQKKKSGQENDEKMVKTGAEKVIEEWGKIGVKKMDKRAVEKISKKKKNLSKNWVKSD